MNVNKDDQLHAIIKQGSTEKCALVGYNMVQHISTFYLTSIHNP